MSRPVKDPLRPLSEEERAVLEHISRSRADAAYRGTLVEWARRFGGWTLEIVSRAAGQTGFQVLPKRWIVERTLAWLGRSRRLSKDYEALPESSEAWLYLAMIHLMLKRLDPTLSQQALSPVQFWEGFVPEPDSVRSVSAGMNRAKLLRKHRIAMQVQPARLFRCPTRDGHPLRQLLKHPCAI